MLYIFCDRPSAGATRLRNAIRAFGYKAKRLRLPVAPSKPGTIINWGSPRWPDPNRVGWPVLNHPEAVGTSISKLRTLDILAAQEVPSVKVSVDKQLADKWLKKGYGVFIRRDGLSEGRGIRNYTGEEKIAAGEFYSRIFPKTHEFRVHVVKGKAIDFTQKKQSNGAAESRIIRLIRSHDNGWVFAHNDLSVIEDDRETLEALACRACEALRLDFGAVDILATLDKGTPRRLSKALICEVNTRPGLENQATIEAYARAFVRGKKEVKNDAA